MTRDRGTLSAQNITLADRLSEVSLTLQPGRITAICGPNGAGKSTLLSALANLITPDQGRVLLGEEGLATMSAQTRARRIGYLPQSAEVAWDVAVRTLVALGRMPHGDEASAPVEQAMAALDLMPFAARPLSTLSGGEKARALLARVLAGEPDWLLADEPLAALDLAHQITLLRHLRAVAGAGAGVVLVLHDLAHAMNHADHVVVLSNGEVAASGPPEEALSETIIASVWGVTAQWIGEGRAQALVVQ